MKNKFITYSSIVINDLKLTEFNKIILMLENVKDISKYHLYWRGADFYLSEIFLLWYIPRDIVILQSGINKIVEKGDTMKTALIAGATGLVGKHLTEILIKSKEYEKVRVLVRKPIDISSPKLEQIIYDYKNPDKTQIKGDHVFCCLGTTIKKAGSPEAFREVDYQFTHDLAHAAFDKGAKKFLLISAIGADKNSHVFYNRVKGETENAVQEILFKSVFIFRPSLLMGKRAEKRPGETIGKFIMQFFKFIIPLKYRAIHGEKVALAMYKYSLKEMNGVHIIESDLMQKL